MLHYCVLLKLVHFDSVLCYCVLLKPLIMFWKGLQPETLGFGIFPHVGSLQSAEDGVDHLLMLPAACIASCSARCEVRRARSVCFVLSLHKHAGYEQC